MTEIKRLKLALLVLHAVGAAFAVVVFAITAASIAEANRAVAAFSASDDTPTTLTRALSSLQTSLGSLGDWSARKLLATSSYVVVGFGSFLNFTMFVSISGMLLSGFLALCYFKAGIYDKTLGAVAAKSPAWAKWPFYELVVAAIWSIFWLAAAGAASDTPFVKIASYCSGISACDQINAIVALSWLSWLIWLAVVVLLAVETGLGARKARKVAAPATATAAAPTKAADVEAPAPAPAAAGDVPAPAPTAAALPGAVEGKKAEKAAPTVELVTATHE